MINKFLQNGDKCWPKMYFKKPGVIFCSCRLFTKHRKRNQKLKEEVIQTTTIRTNKRKLVLLMMHYVLMVKFKVKDSADL